MVGRLSIIVSPILIRAGAVLSALTPIDPLASKTSPDVSIISHRCAHASATVEPVIVSLMPFARRAARTLLYAAVQTTVAWVLVGVLLLLGVPSWGAIEVAVAMSALYATA